METTYKQWRKDLKLSLKNVGMMTGIDVYLISMFEDGWLEMNDDEIENLRSLYGVIECRLKEGVSVKECVNRYKKFLGVIK